MHFLRVRWRGRRKTAEAVRAGLAVRDWRGPQRDTLRVILCTAIWRNRARLRGILFMYFEYFVVPTLLVAALPLCESLRPLRLCGKIHGCRPQHVIW
jgi:hypothetical protein